MRWLAAGVGQDPVLSVRRAGTASAASCNFLCCTWPGYCTSVHIAARTRGDAHESVLQCCAQPCPANGCPSCTILLQTPRQGKCSSSEKPIICSTDSMKLLGVFPFCLVIGALSVGGFYIPFVKSFLFLILALSEK